MRRLRQSTVAVAVLVVAAGAAASIEPPGGYPPTMPRTTMPAIAGCSGQQKEYLREIWPLAHYATWRAERVVAYVQSQPAASRAELWSRGLVVGDAWSPAPRRWFGTYDSGVAKFVRTALDKAEKRFRGAGSVVKGIHKLRCGQGLIVGNKHKDVCPKGNPGSDSPPGAFHFPIGVIVLCPTFWESAGDTSVSRDTRIWNSVAKLVHETFHWLSVNAVYVVDRHADGIGGHPDKKYYGLDNVTYLAEKKRSWASRNNDTYAFFARGAGRSEQVFTGSWSNKEGGDAGGLLFDLTWDELVERWKTLGESGQYLADVETYVRDGKRLYVALWRRGAGNGALGLASRSAFASEWERLRATQDLIDVEVFPSGGELRFLGVFRKKVGKATGSGGLLIGLSWDGLVEKWKEFTDVAYLADVETYVDNGARRYVGVWRAGPGNGSLLLSKDIDEWTTYKQGRNGLETLIDVEHFIDGGRWYHLGVWRKDPGSGPVTLQRPRDELIKTWNDRRETHTLIDIEEYSPLPLRVP